MARKSVTRRFLEDHIAVGVQLNRVHGGYRQAMNRALESIGVTVPQFIALARLGATPGLSNAELARQGDVTPQTMNVILGRLEANGLVTRRPHPEHGRIVMAELTPTGHDVVEACFSEVERVEAAILRVLEPREQSQFLELLTRLGDSLAGDEPG